MVDTKPLKLDQSTTPAIIKEFVSGLDTVPIVLGGTGSSSLDGIINSVAGSVSSLFLTPNSILEASNVRTASLISISSLQDAINARDSAGWFLGGEFTDTGSSVEIGSGIGFIRDDNSFYTTLFWFSWDASSFIPPNLNTRFIGVEYNNGSPRITSKTSDNWNRKDEFPLGVVTLDPGPVIYSKFSPLNIVNTAGLTSQRNYETDPIARDERTGGLILGETGTRNVTLTQGAIWERLNRFDVSSINSSSAPFDSYYLSGIGNWVLVSGQTQWPNTQFNDINTGLVTMTTNRFANLWFYLSVNNLLLMVYGRNEYTSLVLAQSESPPNSIPERIFQNAILIGRLIFKKSENIAQQIDTVFTTNFSVTPVTDHGDLAGLGDDDHPQYQLRSEKSTASGYASLDSTTKVPTEELATGVATASTVFIGNRSWSLVTSSQIENNTVGNEKLRQSAALTVIGRTTNSVGNVADIGTTSGSSHVLREDNFGNLTFGLLSSRSIADSEIGNDKLSKMNANTIRANNTSSVNNPLDFPVGINTVVGRVADNIVAAQVVTAQITNNAVDDTKLRQSAALTVIGRSVNSTGNVADITATPASDAVLRESGSTIGFGTVASGGIANNAVANTKLAQMGANTVKVNNTASLADPTDLTIGTNSVLGRVAGNIVAATLATNQIANNAVTNAKLAQMGANTLRGNDTGSTADPTDISVGASTVVGRVSGNIVAAQLVTAQITNNAVDDTKLRQGAALTVIGRSANSTGNVADIAATPASDAVLRESGSVLGFGTIATGGIANNAVTNAKLAQMAANTIRANPTGSTADSADLSVGTNSVVGRAGGNIVAATLVTNQIANNAVTNAKSAQMAANTIKVNNTNSTADQTDMAVGVNTVVGRAAAGNIVAGQITTGQVLDSAISNAKIRDSAGFSVIGRANTGTGAVADITASSVGHYLQRKDSTVQFATLQTSDLGTGTADTTTFLRGDRSWAAPGDIASEATYTTFSSGVAMSSDALILDLFNDTGSGTVLRILEVFAYIRNTAAVAGIRAPIEMRRTSASGTGGTALSFGNFDTNDAALPAQITARQAATGGATASGNFLAGSRIYSEEGSLATTYPWFEHQICLYANDGLGIRKRLVLRENQGLRVQWGQVIGTAAGLVAVGVTFQTGSASSKALPTFSWMASSLPTADKKMIDIFNATGSGKIVKITRLVVYARPILAHTGVICPFEVIRSNSVGTGGTTITADLYDSNDLMPTGITARDGPTGGAAYTGSVLVADTVGLDEVAGPEFRGPFRTVGGVGSNVQYVFDGNQTGRRRPLTLRENEGIVVRNGPLTQPANGIAIVIVEGTIE